MVIQTGCASRRPSAQIWGSAKLRFPFTDTQPRRRHCERSKAIQGPCDGLLRRLRLSNDDLQMPSRSRRLRPLAPGLVRLRVSRRSSATSGVRARVRRRVASRSHPGEARSADLPTIGAALIELRRAFRGMVCHRRGLFKGAAVLEIGGGTSGPEAVVAELGGYPGRRGTRRTIAWALRAGSTVRVSGRPMMPRPIVRNSGPLGSSRRPAPSR